MKGSKRTGVWVAQWMEDLGLTSNQTRLYAEIVSLDASGGCFASNEYLGTVLRLKKDTISRLVSELKKKGLLKQTGFDGRKRFLKPIFLQVESGLDTNKEGEIENRLYVPVGFGVSSKSGSMEDTMPSHKYQLNKKIHKDINENVRQTDWKEFLNWCERELSFSTRMTLSGVSGPEGLSGLQLTYWKRWKANPG
ncbi:helix-turn-helix domain-containing protein [Leptospira meyeri]|uniref:helix-turn-helix domain-containing protein n=1 Tax=Leptospira meyeri TaxID=29508 RepID=UPI000C2B1FEC|nr:helix-turn-helix domain-containing protein [Leptospira meyeri]PJZ79377.1 DNA-binding protein [Leptospira meyeri]PJZ95209.1 DNA-binding protein [Leptospira meyeri]